MGIVEDYEHALAGPVDAPRRRLLLAILAGAVVVAAAAVLLGWLK